MTICRCGLRDFAVCIKHKDSMIPRIRDDAPSIAKFVYATRTGEAVKPAAWIACRAVLPDDFPITANLDRNMRKIVRDENVVVLEKLHTGGTTDARYPCPQIPQQPPASIYFDDVDLVHFIHE